MYEQIYNNATFDELGSIQTDLKVELTIPPQTIAMLALLSSFTMVLWGIIKVKTK